MLISEFRKKSKYSISIALAALVLYSYFPAFDNDFVHWDDQFYITLNPLITTPSLANLKELWGVIISLNYHPLTMSTLWINSFFQGVDSAFPFISTNVAIHFCNVLLLYHLISILFPQKNILSLFVLIVFAIHPMHVESVVWVSERKDVLYAFFFLCSLLAYIKFSIKGQRQYYYFSFCLFVLACLSKAMAVSLVPVLFVIDIFREGRMHYKKVAQKIPFILVALLFGMIAINIQDGGNAFGWLQLMANEKAMSTNASVTFWERLSYGSFGLLYYMKQFFSPLDLAAYHPYGNIIMGKYFLLSPLVFLLIGLAILISYRYDQVIFLGFMFFLSTIILVLQFLPVGSALYAERYTYLPYIGLSIVVGRWLQLLYDKFSKVSVFLVLFCVTVVMSMLTRKQSDVWQNQITLFSQVVERYPEDASSRHYLATGYWQEEKYDEAIRHLTYAIDTLYSLSDQNFELLANSFAEKGDHKKALAFYNEAVRINPMNVVARYHRSLLLLDIDPAQVITDLTICQESDNIYVNQFIYAIRGRAYGKLHQYENAIRDFRQAIEISPEEVWNYYDLGLTYELSNDFEKALKVYQEGLRISPDFQYIIERIAILKGNLE